MCTMTLILFLGIFPSKTQKEKLVFGSTIHNDPKLNIKCNLNLTKMNKLNYVYCGILHSNEN